MNEPIALSADEREHLPPPETRARLAAFARECIANSGGDADGGERVEKIPKITLDTRPAARYGRG